MMTSTDLRRLADLMDRGNVRIVQVNQELGRQDYMEMEIRVVVLGEFRFDNQRRRSPEVVVVVNPVPARDPDRWISEMEESMRPRPRVLPPAVPLSTRPTRVRVLPNQPPLVVHDLGAMVDLLVAIIKVVVLAWASQVVNRTNLLELK